MKERISKEQIKKIAALARLMLTEKEAEDAAAYMAELLAYVEKLSKVDTEKVEPYAPAPIHLNDLRKDVAVHFGNRDGLLPKEKFNSDDLLETKGVFKRNNEH